MRGVFLIGKDWSTRALLRAELLEEGVDVLATETVDTVKAVMALEEAGALPSLIVADLSSSDHPKEDADWLAQLANAVPIWIITGRTLMVPKNLNELGFEKILSKPLEVSELVKQIKTRLGPWPS